MSNVQIKLCNAELETGYCERCGCFTSRDEGDRYPYCKAFEDDLNSLESDDEYFDEFGHRRDETI